MPMTPSTSAVIALLAFFPAAVSAQDLSAPVLGFAYDASQNGLRQISGVPGAASLDNRIELGVSVSRVAVASQRSYALAETDLGLVLLNLAAKTRVIVPGAQSGADRIAFSPSGDAAALYFPAALKIQILTGLPKSPKLAADVDVFTVGGKVLAFAVSDGGRAVLAQVPGGALFNWTGGVAFSPVAWTGDAAAIAFLNGGGDAVIADRAQSQIVMLRDGQPATLASLNVGSSFSVQASLDNRFVIAANGDDGTLASIDIGSGSSSSIMCDCRPTGLTRLRGTAVFQLTEASGDQPLWVFDGDGAAPRVVFVGAGGAL